MDIKYLEIQGFKSIKEIAKFDFEILSNGFYFVSGKNNVEESLGSNGAGKSTFFSDALMWILTGKTSLGLKAGNVKSWNSSLKCQGLVRVLINNVDYEIFRSWNPNSLKIRTLDDDFNALISIEKTQEELDDLLGFNHISLLHSVVLSQFSTKFFDLDPAPKLQVFSDILGDVDIWLDYSKSAKDRFEDTQRKGLSESNKIEKLRGSLETLQSQDVKTQFDDWESVRKDKIVKYKNDVSMQKEEVTKQKKDLREIGNDLDNAIQAQDKAGEGLPVIEAELSTLLVLVKDKERFAFEAKIIKDREAVEIDKFEKVDKICPHCEQEVSEEYLHEKLTQLKQSIVEFALKEKTYYKECDDIDATRNILEIQKKKIIEQYDRYCEKTHTFEKEEQRVIDSIKYKKDSLVEKEQLIIDTKDMENPHLKSRDKNIEDIKNMKIAIKEKEVIIYDLIDQEKVYEYWSKAYKEIRLLVIDEALAEFEIYLNNNLENLGLYGWKIRVAIDKETQSKTVKKGFYVTVESPHQSKPVPFDCYCGGEKGALRLCGTLGLMEFIKHRKGVDCNIEIWDEPTVNLSPEVTDNLLCLFKRRSEDKKILFIDHHKLGSSGEFSGTICVTKNEQGSHVELLN